MERTQDKIIKNGITQGVIWKQLLLFFFPLLFGTFFQQFYNTVDAVIVGRFVGKEALSAVGGATGTIINIFVGFFVGLSSGATVIISQFYGGSKERDVEASVHTSIAMAIIGGLIIMLAGLIGAPYALRAMNTPESILPDSLVYIRIYFVGMTANLIYNMGAGILRAVGDSRRPLYFLIAGCITNVVLDVIFVILLHMAVAGVAIATVLSQVISAVLVCMTLMRSGDCYRLVLRKIRIHRAFLGKIIRIGLPAGLQSLMYSISNVLIQSSVNRFGTDTIAAWTAYGKIDGLFWMIIGSFGVAITTIVGQNYGAGLHERVRKSVRQCLLLALIATLVLSGTLFFFGGYVYELFTSDAEVIRIGVRMMRYLVPTYVTYICIEILSGALRGMGNALIPMLLTGGGVCVLRVVWILAVVPLHPDILTVLTSYPVTWVITSVLFLIYYTWYMKKKRIGGAKQ